ncbi:acyl carrier protein [Prosthecobacter fusiformis]|uniref:Acyl carrier protein n=1 Tax=Prosthecobacter fusiformis TaxID=48464 RepID=A0A4R7RU78_9BACT|nr:acyl carrier protein [Prosthecobacter fusiformis]TDU69230.1 acyl carrier protein [Prosthecobacter fusiformis]
MNETLNSIVEIIREAVPGLEIDPAKDSDRTFKDLGLDSLDKMSLLLGVQEKWNLEFNEEEISNLNTINDIYRKVS